MTQLNRRFLPPMPRFPGCFVGHIDKTTGLQGNGNTYNEKLQYPNIAIDVAGNTFVAFDSATAPAYTDQWAVSVVKFGAYGALEWQRKLNLVDSTQGRVFYARPSAIATDPSGNVYVSVTPLGSAATSYAQIFKISPAGTLLWCRRISYSGGTTQVLRIVIDAQGYVYLCSGNDNETFVAKFNNEMDTMLWRVSGPKFGASNFTMSPNGQYVAYGGTLYVDSTTQQNYVVRVDAATGAMNAFQIYSGTSQLNGAYVGNGGELWAYHYGSGGNAGFLKIDPTTTTFKQVPAALFSNNSSLQDGKFGPDGLFWSFSIYHGLMAMDSNGVPVASYQISTASGWIPGGLAFNEGGTTAMVGWDVSNYTYLDIVKVPNDGTGQGVYGQVNYATRTQGALSSATTTVYQTSATPPASSTLVLSNTLLSSSTDGSLSADSHPITIYNIATG